MRFVTSIAGASILIFPRRMAGLLDLQFFIDALKLPKYH